MPRPAEERTLEEPERWAALQFSARSVGVHARPGSNSCAEIASSSRSPGASVRRGARREGGMNAAKMVGAAIAARGRVALVGSSEGERGYLCFTRPPGVGAAMDATLRTVLPIVGGRGGGSPEIAQGSGNASRLAEALAVASQLVKAA